MSRVLRGTRTVPASEETMPAPYRGDEIAAALMAAVERGELSASRITVIADEKANCWVIRSDQAGEQRTLTFPFASAEGIYTPAEIVARVVGGGWPFG